MIASEKTDTSLFPLVVKIEDVPEVLIYFFVRHFLDMYFVEFDPSETTHRTLFVDLLGAKDISKLHYHFLIFNDHGRMNGVFDC